MTVPDFIGATNPYLAYDCLGRRALDIILGIERFPRARRALLHVLVHYNTKQLAPRTRRFTLVGRGNYPFLWDVDLGNAVLDRELNQLRVGGDA